MTDYTKSTNFATKDSLPSGNPAKIVKGTEINTEFDNIATAVATKSNSASPTFTGTLTAADVSITGNTTLGNDATDTVTITADVASNVIPSADSTYTLGDASNYWSHGYVDAVTTTGDVSVGGNLTVTGNATISGNLTFGDASTDTINLTADIASNILPSADNTYDIGGTGAEWKDIYINGVAYVDSIDLAGTSITATGAELNTLDGITATTAELNTLDGITATVAELNTLDGITATVTELNYTDGVTSAIQTQLDNKQPLSAVLTATTASFTTADETKLDGIETGATADQTASEILSALLTVDGTGTGLDADLLDGNEATAFATAAQGTLADSALQSSDIGVTVQGYDADTAKYDDTTANFTGTLQNAGSNVVVDSDIGSTVLAYDSNLQSFVTTFTVPTSDGTNGQALITDGAGTISFGNVDALPSQTGNNGYYLTTDGTTASWAAISQPSYTYVRTNFTATAAQTTFTVSYTAGYVDVYMNGVKLIVGTDVTATNGTSIVLASGAAAGDLIEVVAFETFNVSNALTSGNNLSDVSSATTAVSNLGFTVTAAELNDFNTVPAVGTKTSSYTLATSDTGKYVQVGTGGSITIPDATFSEGDVVNIFNNTTGDITITCSITTAYISGTDTDVSSVTLATRGLCTIFFISGTVCVIAGAVS